MALLHAPNTSSFPSFSVCSTSTSYLILTFTSVRFSIMYYRIFFYLVFVFGATSAVVAQLPGHVGVCNGRKGNNLPSERDVVQLYKTNGIKRMRIYGPDQLTLAALRDSDIELILDVPNGELGALQSDATKWVETNVVPFIPATKIRYIAVGNEVDPDNESSRFVPLILPAMESIHRALSARGLQDQIKVSTATYSAILSKDSFPPSKSSFKNSFMTPIVAFLAKNRSPLLANIYPYFAYIGDTMKTTPLDYALFTLPGVVVRDNGLEYKNLFGAMVDSMYYALEKAGGAGVRVVVSESGWPSGGGMDSETVANAETYYRNLIGSVGSGTPKKPGVAVETYLFAMFDENDKPGAPTEQHFGLFSPVNKTPKYQLGLKSA